MIKNDSYVSEVVYTMGIPDLILKIWLRTRLCVHTIEPAVVDTNVRKCLCPIFRHQSLVPTLCCVYDTRGIALNRLSRSHKLCTK